MASLVIMSFNLRTINHNDGEHNWPYRQESVRQIITQYKPHILGTQEGKPEAIAFLEMALPTYTRIGLGREADRRGEYAAIFVRNDTFTMERHGDFWLSDTPDIPGSKHWGNNCVRMATYVVLRAENHPENHRFLCLNTHFDHESSNAQERAATLVVEFLQRQGMPAIVMGDLNASWDSLPLRILTGRAELAGLRGSLSNTAETFGGHLQATFHGFGRVCQPTATAIDHILVTAHFRCRDFRIIRDRPYNQYPSDHYPVLALVEQTS